MQNKKRILLSLIFSLIIFVTPALTLAVDSKTDGSNKISVNPSIINLKVKQGETINSSFSYINGTTKEQDVSFSISPFESSGVSGSQPVFYTKDGKEIMSPSKDWIKINDTDKKIAAETDKEISFSITVPKDAEIKRYQNAIFVNSSSLNEADKLSGLGNLINYRAGVLVFLDVEKNERNIFGLGLLCGLILVLIMIAVLVFWYNKKRTDKKIVFFEDFEIKKISRLLSAKLKTDLSSPRGHLRPRTHDEKGVSKKRQGKNKKKGR